MYFTYLYCTFVCLAISSAFCPDSFYFDQPDETDIKLKCIPYNIYHNVYIKGLDKIHKKIHPFCNNYNYYRFVLDDHEERCVSAVATNIVSGVCSLSPDCVGSQEIELKHTWYGSKVRFCYGYDSGSNIVSGNYSISVNEPISQSDVIHAAYLFSTFCDELGYSFPPKRFLGVLKANLTTETMLNPKGDWHTVNYETYPVRSWFDSYKMSTDPYVPYFYLINNPYTFSCGACNISYSSCYYKQNCGKLVMVDDEVSICSNVIRRNTLKTCPLDFLIRRQRNHFTQTVFIKQSDTGFISGIIDTIVSKITSITKPIFKDLLKVLFEFVIDTFKALADVLNDLEPDIEKFLNTLVKVLQNLLPFLCKLLAKLIHLTFVCLSVLNKYIMLFESIIFVIFLSHYFKIFTSLLIYTLCISVVGINRPGWLEAVYSDVNGAEL